MIPAMSRFGLHALQSNWPSDEPRMVCLMDLLMMVWTEDLKTAENEPSERFKDFYSGAVLMMRACLNSDNSTDGR